MQDDRPSGASTESAQQLPAVWWIAALSSVGLLALLAFHAEVYRVWSTLVTAKVAQLHLRAMLLVVLVAHVAEALYAVRLAQQAGHPDRAPAWFAQTLMVGYPSLRLLLRCARHSH